MQSQSIIDRRNQRKYPHEQRVLFIDPIPAGRHRFVRKLMSPAWPTVQWSDDDIFSENEEEEAHLCSIHELLSQKRESRKTPQIYSSEEDMNNTSS